MSFAIGRAKRCHKLSTFFVDQVCRHVVKVHRCLGVGVVWIPGQDKTEQTSGHEKVRIDLVQGVIGLVSAVNLHRRSRGGGDSLKNQHRCNGREPRCTDGSQVERCYPF